MSNWWETESSVQNLLESAFKKALADYGVAKSGDIPNNAPDIDPSNIDNQQTPDNSQDTAMDITPETVTNNDGKTVTQIEQEISAFTTAMKLPSKAVEIYDQSLDALSKTVSPVLDQYNLVQEAYGGLNIDLDKAVGSSRAVIDRLQSMQKYYYDVGNAGTDMSKKLGFSSNIVSKYFKDEAEAFNESEEVLGALVDQHSQYINKLDEETLTKLPFYSKALGISSNDVAESVERSINSTGKAQTTMLDDIAKFSQGLHKSTGIPLKAIAQNAVQISNDTQRLGDVTAEEATRISATLGQLGQTYDSFTGVLDKFQEFGSAAETSGLISQITGGAVNLDAQHLMYLASEEQEKFLPELRRSLLGGGFTKEVFEGMAQAEQRQLASTLSMDREKLRALLDTGREFNEADLIAEQEKIAADKTDGFKAVTEQMELAPKYADKTKESMDYLRTKAIVPLQKDLLLAADEYSKLNSNIRDNVELTDSAAIAGGFRKTIQKQGAIAKGMSNQIDTETNIGVGGLGNLLSSQNPVYSAGPSNNQPIQVIMPDSPTETDKQVLNRLEEVQATNIENGTSSSTNNEATNKLIQDLTTAVTLFNSNASSNKELVLQVDKNELGRILIDGEYIIAGEPTKLVRTD